LYKKTYELIKNTPGINFVGNVEGKTIIDDLCEVAVCDGFVGNMHLKALEGGLKLFASEIRKQIKMAGPLGIIAGLLLKITGVFDKLKARFHPNSYGGALLGGIDGVSIISHGSSNAEAIKNACKQARLLVSKDVINKVKRELAAD
jgi:glycerol-3-phosphate acyltransferase PlsX